MRIAVGLVAVAGFATRLQAQDGPDRPLPELEYQADRHDDAQTPE